MLDISGADPVQASPSTPRQWLNLVVLLGGLALLLWLGLYVTLLMPIWVAPPYLSSTPWLYFPVVFGWLIALIVLTVTRQIRMSVMGKFVAFILIVGDVLVFAALIFVFSLSTFSCNPAQLTDALVHYDCKQTIQAFVPATDYSGPSTIPLKFQGWSGWPFVTQNR